MNIGAVFSLLSELQLKTKQTI